MTEQGVVLSVKNNFAKVRVERNSACASCGKCGMSSRQKHADFFADNCANAKAGDAVVLEIPEANSAKFALVGYFLPILPAIGLLFLALGVGWPEWSAAPMFLGGLVIGFAIVALIDKLRRHKWTETPKIVEVVQLNTPKKEPTVDGETTAEVTVQLNPDEQNNEKGDNKNE